MKKSSPAHTNTSKRPDSVAAAMLAGALYSFGVSVMFVLAMLALPLAMHASGDILTALDWWMRSIVWLLIGLGAVVFMIGSLILKANRFQSPYVYGLVGGACIAALSMPLGTWLIPLKLPVNTFMVTVILVAAIGAAVLGSIHWLLQWRFAYALVAALLVTCGMISVGAMSWLSERTAHASAVRFVDMIPYKIFIPPRDSGWTQAEYFDSKGSYMESSYIVSRDEPGKESAFDTIEFRPLRESTLPRAKAQGACIQDDDSRWDRLDTAGVRRCDQIYKDDALTIYLERDQIQGVESAPYAYYVIRGGVVYSTWDARGEDGRKEMMLLLRELEPATTDEWAELRQAQQKSRQKARG